MDDVATCYRHPSEATRITCQRCDRPICGSCMIPGSVGFQCPECVHRGNRETRQHQLPYGGVRSSNPKATSIALIAVNVLVWVAVLLTGGSNGRLFATLALMPNGHCEPRADGMFLIDRFMCLQQGAEWWPGVASGAPWQVITSAFTHVSPLHILFNMLMLFLLGPQVEGIMGRARFLAIYFIAALGGSAGVMLFSAPFVKTMGASGAVYGLMGALLILALKHKGDVRGILMWIGLNVAFSFMVSGISWEGHLGGLVGGVAAISAFVMLPKQHRARWGWPLAGLAALVFIGIIVARALTLAV
ncbi:MAG TPA: rhomboid family intramembrane serine protease [Tessaracoccus flavescens]|uniref:Rhomboid family intramembrane serine protease n=1 Tax=Tessaracoccus flavescens TaxID=399497 RepID=A0A921EP35_9ACTN|nr:rhomboid family intramembrane serine protease [Tessaracoccus flavescens]